MMRTPQPAYQWLRTLRAAVTSASMTSRRNERRPNQSLTARSSTTTVMVENSASITATTATSAPESARANVPGGELNATIVSSASTTATTRTINVHPICV
jgi:hypothetical protein